MWFLIFKEKATEVLTSPRYDFYRNDLKAALSSSANNWGSSH